MISHNNGIKKINPFLVDECKDPANNTCMSPNATAVGEEDGKCINMIGTYMCDCPRGMKWNMTYGGCIGEWKLFVKR